MQHAPDGGGHEYPLNTLHDPPDTQRYGDGHCPMFTIVQPVGWQHAPHVNGGHAIETHVVPSVNGRPDAHCPTGCTVHPVTEQHAPICEHGFGLHDAAFIMTTPPYVARHCPLLMIAQPELKPVQHTTCGRHGCEVHEIPAKNWYGARQFASAVNTQMSVAALQHAPTTHATPGVHVAPEIHEPLPHAGAVVSVHWPVEVLQHAPCGPHGEGLHVVPG